MRWTKLCSLLLSIVLFSFSAVADDPPKKDPAWNGSHFYLESADGNYSLQPYGYIQTDFRIYTGDGVPPDTFTIRRARFGFTGKLDKYYEFSVLADFADGNSTLLRDGFFNVNYWRPFQVTIGQFTEPFGQESASFSISNIDFVERGLTSLLYPSANNAFRSPGAMVHGDLAGGTLSYWLGAFTGKGFAANTTNQPEVIGRLRVYPLKTSDIEGLRGLAVGGAVGIGRSRGFSNEMSFSGFVPERSFAFFPQVTINGPIYRYNAEATWTGGPASIRAEYDALHQKRDSLDVGYTNLPEVRAWGFNISATWLLTGEKRPENAPPKAAMPLFKGGIGAWELKARYSYLTAITGGDAVNAFPGFNNTVDEFSFGLNWYLTTSVKYNVDANFYRDRDNATVGGAPPQTFVVILQRVQIRF